MRRWVYPKTIHFTLTDWCTTGYINIALIPPPCLVASLSLFSLALSYIHTLQPTPCSTLSTLPCRSVSRYSSQEISLSFHLPLPHPSLAFSHIDSLRNVRFFEMSTIGRANTTPRLLFTCGKEKYRTRNPNPFLSGHHQPLSYVHPLCPSSRKSRRPEKNLTRWN